MSDNIPMLKSLQYLIICKAGLAVCEEIKASTEELRREIQMDHHQITRWTVKERRTELSNDDT